jgi:hypothetical protein
VLAPAAGAATPASGIVGRATLGPTCPVEPVPPDPRCAPRGFRAVVRVVRRADGRLVEKATSDRSGRFRIRVKPGRYRVSARAPSGAKLPACPTRNVTVLRGRFEAVRLACDSGVR